MFEIKDISLEDNLLHVKFTSKDALDHLKVEFRLKDMTRYAVSAYNEFLGTDITSKEKMHELKLDISSLSDHFNLENLTKQIVWIFINNDGQYHKLKIGKSLAEKIKNIGTVKYCDVANLSLLNNGNSLALSITKVNVSSTVKEVEIKEGSLLLDLSPITFNDKEIKMDTVQIKKRIFKDTLVYGQAVQFKSLGSGVYSLDLKDLKTIDYDMVTNLDFITTIRDKKVSVDIPILLSGNIKLHTFSFHPNLKSKLYSTVKKSLSLRVEKENQTIEIVNSAIEDQFVTLEVSLSSLNTTNHQSLKCGLFRQNILFNDPELTLFKNVTMQVQDSTAYLTLDLLDLFSEVAANYEQNYIVALYDANDEAKFVIHLISSEKVEQKAKTKKSIISFNIQKDAKIVVSPKTDNPIRLSILGSCFSRAAFNSSNPFFNKDYKYYFNLDYSHFWISLISAVSDKIPFDESNFSDVPAKVINNVRKEYEKTTFDDLVKTQSDYIILDFFVDAVHGVRRLPDGKFLGQNGDMHSSYYYKHHILKETSQFDFRHPDFWDTWTRSCDEFITRLKKIIDMDHIILNLGGLSDPYYDESREKSSFSKDKKFTTTEVNFINHTWEKMNNYFLSKVPSAKVIDLTQYNYLASLDYPYGGSGPHHYERNYYKTFLGELSKVILMDKLQ
jgi:hypothetical protein